MAQPTHNGVTHGEILFTSTGDHYRVVVSARVNARLGVRAADRVEVYNNETNKLLSDMSHYSHWCCNALQLAESLASAPAHGLVRFCGNAAWRCSSGWRPSRDEFGLTPGSVVTTGDTNPKRFAWSVG